MSVHRAEPRREMRIRTVFARRDAPDAYLAALARIADAEPDAFAQMEQHVRDLRIEAADRRTELRDAEARIDYLEGRLDALEGRPR